jgi:hypothetical protein
MIWATGDISVVVHMLTEFTREAGPSNFANNLLEFNSLISLPRIKNAQSSKMTAYYDLAQFHWEWKAGFDCKES